MTVCTAGTDNDRIIVDDDEGADVRGQHLLEAAGVEVTHARAVGFRTRLSLACAINPDSPLPLLTDSARLSVYRRIGSHKRVRSRRSQHHGRDSDGHRSDGRNPADARSDVSPSDLSHHDLSHHDHSLRAS